MTLSLTRVIRGFTEGGRLDWLHPSHGQFPDFAAEYMNDKLELFEVLVWDDGFSWISMVQGPDWYHGGYPHSYRWWPNAPEPTSIWCRPTKGNVYDVDVQWSIRSKVLKQVAAASVHVHITTEPYPQQR